MTESSWNTHGRASVPLRVVSGVTRIVDAFVVLLASVAAFRIYLVDFPADIPVDLYFYVTLIGTLLQINIFYFAKLYTSTSLRQPFNNFGRLILSWTILFSILVALAFLTKTSDLVSRAWAVIWFVFGLAGFIGVRGVLVVLMRRWRRSGRLVRNIVIVGANEPGRRLIQHLDSLPDSDVRLLGVFDDRNIERLPPTIEGYPTNGNVDDLLAFVRKNRVDLIIVALPWSAEERLLSVLEKLRTLPMDVRLSPDLIGFHFPATSFSHIGRVPLFNVHDKPLSDWSLVTKRAMDVILSALFLLILFPVFLVITVLVKLDSTGPVIFSQKRYGFNNQLIKMHKFRTMYADQADPDAERLTSRDDPRVTRIGRFLRRWSLDELPQLVNVFKGDMSMVGPRPHPLLAKAAGKLYEDAVTQFAARYRVKPGITGWAQVNGWRGETETVNDIKKRVEYDIYYIENWSIVLDIKIIVMTIFSVVLGKNAH